MAFDSVFLELTCTWDSVERSLDPDSRAVLADAVARFGDSGASAHERLVAANDVIDLLSAAPLPPDHPVRVALRDSGSRLSAGTAEDLAVTAGRMRLFLQARAHLLALPALTPETLRQNGVDPDLKLLIRLSGVDGDRYPAFQFDREGQPLPVVLTVNRILGAAGDPWGAADWWSGGSAWLAGRKPADLLAGDAAEHERVVAVARATVEGE